MIPLSRYKYIVRSKECSLADQGLKFGFQTLIGRGTEYSKLIQRSKPLLSMLYEWIY